MNGIFFDNFENSYLPNILKEIYLDKVYDPFFKNKKDMVVLDCGASFDGMFSYYAYNKSKKIYAIEPSTQHLKILKHMIDFNKMGDRVEIVPKAIALENGKQKFYHNDNVTMFSLSDTVNDKEDFEEVDTVRIDTLLEELKIGYVDFMKLDIEGSEVDIVGSESFKRVSKQIKSLVVEYHSWSGRNPSQLTTTLMDLGYIVKPIPADAILYGAIRP